MHSELKKLLPLKTFLGTKGWVEDPNIIEPHLIEERGLYKGKSDLLLKPINTSEVSSILKLCNKYNINILIPFISFISFIISSRKNFFR